MSEGKEFEEVHKRLNLLEGDSESMCEGAVGGAKPKVITSTPKPKVLEVRTCDKRNTVDSGYFTDSPGLRDPSSPVNPVQFSFGDDALSLLGGHIDTLHDEPAELSDVFESPGEEEEQNIEDEIEDDSDVVLRRNVSPPCSIPNSSAQNHRRNSVGLGPNTGFGLFYSITPPRPIGPYLSHRFSTGCVPSYGLDSPSRSAATQTPNQHCQMIQAVIRTQEQGSSPVLQRFLARGNVVERFRSQSVGDNQEEGSTTGQPLPDIIPEGALRDRSCSEPYIRSSLERYFGGELRRISDEFHQSYEELPHNNPNLSSNHCNNVRPPPHSSSFPSDRPRSWWHAIVQMVPPLRRRSHTNPRQPHRSPHNRLPLYRPHDLHRAESHDHQHGVSHDRDLDMVDER